MAHPMDKGAGGASTAPTPSPPVTPQDFVDAAAGASQYEIRAAQTALAQSKNPAVRAFAQEMIRGHDAMIANLRDAALLSSLKPPLNSVGGDQSPLLAALQGLTGVDFDKAYARQQILAHCAALATEGAYARTGSDRNLRDVANADLPVIEGHLKTARSLQRSVGE